MTNTEQDEPAEEATPEEGSEHLDSVLEVLIPGTGHFEELLNAAASIPQLDFAARISAYRQALDFAQYLKDEFEYFGYGESNVDDIRKILNNDEKTDSRDIESDDDIYDTDNIANLALFVLGSPRLAAGYLVLNEGEGACAEGRWRNAAQYYKEVETNLRGLADWAPFAGVGDHEIPYSRMMSRFALGLHQSEVGARVEAIKEFQAASARARDELVPAIEALEDENMVAILRNQVDVIDCTAICARAVQDFVAGRYADAERRYRELSSRSEAAMEKIRTSSIPLAHRGLLLRGREAGLASAKAYLALSQGELAREGRNWAEAMEMYGIARDAFERISEAMAGIDTPAAAAAQSSALNQVLVEIAERSCDNDRELWTQVEAAQEAAQRAEAERDRFSSEKENWRSALGTLSQLGIAINVSNHADANAAAQAVAENTAHLNLAMHQQMIDDLDKLKGAIGASKLPESDRAKLGAEIDALKSDGNKESLFRRVGKFVEDSAKLLKSVDEAAGPLGKVVRWVVPIAPIASGMLGLS